MPTSDSWGKDWVEHTIGQIAIKHPILSVVDVGAGNGTYIKLLGKNIPFAHWLAIEAWGPYVEEYGLDRLYDTVVVSDVRYVDTAVLSGDLVIFGDILEHMKYHEAVDVLSNVIHGHDDMQHHIVLICVPMLHLEQGPVNGNPFERHEMGNHFTEERMLKMLQSLGIPGGGYRLDMHIGDVVGYFLLRKGVYAEDRKG